MVNNELRTRLRRAADLLEALASDSPASSVPEHDTISSESGATEYVDLAAGQSGGAVPSFGQGRTVRHHGSATSRAAP